MGLCSFYRLILNYSRILGWWSGEARCNGVHGRLGGLGMGVFQGLRSGKRCGRGGYTRLGGVYCGVYYYGGRRSGRICGLRGRMPGRCRFYG